MLILQLVVLIWTFLLVRNEQDYNTGKYNIWQPRQQPNDRLIKLMQNYMEFGIVRVQEIKEIRWKHEQSLQYELGYLIGDLVERYKKMVDEVRRAYVNIDGKHLYLPNDLFHIVVKVENCQKIYFEIYHIVRMIHELPKKWMYKVVYKKQATEDTLFLKMKEDYEKAMKIAAEQKAKRIAKQKELMKAKRNATQYNGTTTAAGNTNSKPYNVWWPYDYGWELDAYGW